MKRIKLFLVCTWLFFACEKKEAESPISINVAVVVDRTDPIDLQPTQSILKFYELSQNMEREAFFRISQVTDRRLNKAIEYRLPSGGLTEKQNTSNDPYYREKLVLQFYDLAKSAIAEMKFNSSKDSSLKHTECFRSLAQELQEIVKKKAAKSYLLVYSDLLENSLLYSCYNASNRNDLLKKPGDLVTIFDSTHLLPLNLSNVEVMFLYQPKSREDDEIFNAIAQVYKILIEKRNGTVKIQANL